MVIIVFTSVEQNKRDALPRFRFTRLISCISNTVLGDGTGKMGMVWTVKTKKTKYCPTHGTMNAALFLDSVTT